MTARTNLADLRNSQAVLTAEAPVGADDLQQIAQSLRYDYASLGDIGGSVRERAIAIKRSERRAGDAIIAAGYDLIAVKSMLPHGQWENWLHTEFTMTPRTAQTMMQIAERFGAKNEIISVLSPTVLGLLAAPSVPDEAVDAVLDASTSAGKTVSVAQAKAIIEHHKPARLFVGDLKTVASEWMAMHWQHPWPDNPSHANGALWQELTAWLHANRTETWTEGDLKAAIKQLHHAHVQQARAGAAEDSSVLASDATGSRQHGAPLGKCRVCNRPLYDPTQAAAGIGACCAAKLAADSHAGEQDQDSATEPARSTWDYWAGQGWRLVHNATAERIGRPHVAAVHDGTQMATPMMSGEASVIYWLSSNGLLSAANYALATESAAAARSQATQIQAMIETLEAAAAIIGPYEKITGIYSNSRPLRQTCTAMIETLKRKAEQAGKDKAQP